jgi:hypothetical protein
MEAAASTIAKLGEKIRTGESPDFYHLDFRRFPEGKHFFRHFYGARRNSLSADSRRGRRRVKRKIDNGYD